MASTPETVETSVDEKPRTEESEETTLLGFATDDWRPANAYGRKEERWLSGDASEIYIEETGDWEDTDAEYLVKYREGRLGPSDQLEYGEFDELENAVEYAEIILDGEADLEELRV